MREKLALEHVPMSVARIVVDGGVVGSPSAYKSIEKEKAFGNVKFEGGIKTELLVAEVFVGQIPINVFLKKMDATNLLDIYYVQIYSLLKEEYRYFKNDYELKLFETLIQARYKEYYAAVKNEENYTLALAKKVSKILAAKDEGLLAHMLASLFTNEIVTISDFIRGVEEKFEVIPR